MTVDTIERAKALVDEICGNNESVHSVWQYQNKISGGTLYAVFVSEQYCDIGESSYVINPVRIYRYDLWLGNFAYLNND